VVEWICMNVLNLEYETTDKIAFYYVAIVTILLIGVLSRWWLWRRRAYYDERL
jgi:membrane protein DedA with SNARE-associated domain